MFSVGEDVEADALFKRGWTVSAIARHLERDRKTVRSYLSGERQAGVRRPARPIRRGQARCKGTPTPTCTVSCSQRFNTRRAPDRRVSVSSRSSRTARVGSDLEPPGS
jgi:hypothetical protein